MIQGYADIQSFQSISKVTHGIKNISMGIMGNRIFGEK
jgi:hypothetical protein